MSGDSQPQIEIFADWEGLAEQSDVFQTAASDDHGWSEHETVVHQRAEKPPGREDFPRAKAASFIGRFADETTGAHQTDIRPILQECDLALQFCGKPFVVRIEEGDEWAVGYADGTIPCSRWARMSLGDKRASMRIGLQDLHRPIGGAVIDGKNMKVLISLPKYRIECALQSTLSVIARKNHCNFVSNLSAGCHRSDLRTLGITEERAQAN